MTKNKRTTKSHTTRPAQAKIRVSAKNARPRKMKSSLEARRLARAAIKKTGSLRAAAKLLKIESHGSLDKMLKGKIKDTPAMQAVLDRRQRAAQKKFYFINEEDAVTLDCDQLRQIVQQLDALSQVFNSLLKSC